MTPPLPGTPANSPSSFSPRPTTRSGRREEHFPIKHSPPHAPALISHINYIPSPSTRLHDGGPFSRTGDEGRVPASGSPPLPIYHVDEDGRLHAQMGLWRAFPTLSKAKSAAFGTRSGETRKYFPSLLVKVQGLCQSFEFRGGRWVSRRCSWKNSRSPLAHSCHARLGRLSLRPPFFLLRREKTRKHFQKGQ